MSAWSRSSSSCTTRWRSAAATRRRRSPALSAYDRRAVTIETGIQNSGLGLVLIFAFFGGLGGMAVVAAFWGIWHAISGIALACDHGAHGGGAMTTHPGHGCCRHVGQAFLGRVRAAAATRSSRPIVRRRQRCRTAWRFESSMCRRQRSRIGHRRGQGPMSSSISPRSSRRRRTRRANFAYDVDVTGTRNVLDACLKHGVRRARRHLVGRRLWLSCRQSRAADGDRPAARQ